MQARAVVLTSVVSTLSLPGTLLGQAALAGTVRSDSSSRPLGGVEVVIEGLGRSTSSDTAGRFFLSRLPSGGQVILFRAVGYRPQRVRVFLTERDTARADAAMVREAVQQLDPLEVAGKTPAPRGIGVEAFEERRKLGFGKFIDSSELRRNENRRVTDLLYGISGLRLVRYRECLNPLPPIPRGCGPIELRAATGRGVLTIYGGRHNPANPNDRDTHCWMTVILDGATLYAFGNDVQRPPDWSKDFRVADLHAIEIYRSAAEVPSEYGGTTAACGVIRLWSRRG